MINAKLFRKIRVRTAQITFYSLVFYCFVYAPITLKPFSDPLSLAGIAIATLGVLIRSLSAGFISKNNVLATTGLYALTRNPLYFGSFLIFVGLNIVIWNALFAVVTAMLFLITYIPTILAEESKLKREFASQWPDFERGTPRFFPALWRLHAYREIQWNFAQWKRNHEWHAVVTVAVVLLLLYVYSVS